MEQTDKQELLDAIKGYVIDAVAAISDHVDERIDALTKEVRSGYEHLDRRLEAVEENTAAMSTTLDKLLEGDALGTEHITLTRPEYDALTDTCHLPNRFLAHAADE